MKLINKHLSPIKYLFLLLAFKLAAFGAIVFLAPDFLSNNTLARIPASGQESCLETANSIISKNITIDDNITSDAVTKFWKKKDGTLIGSSYFKAKKAIFKKLKNSFMDINSNFRPIYYIEDDSASYPKIFKFIEEKSAKKADAEATPLEKEIGGWVTKFQAYTSDMENLVAEYASLLAYVKKLEDLKSSKDTTYPFEIELKLLKDGKEVVLKDYAGGPEDLDNLIFKLSGKAKKLKGTSYFRFGAIDTRDFDQALLSTRLKSLESEIRDHLASNPADEPIFTPMLKQLLAINRDPQYLPTLKLMAKLEYKEMNAEYKDLFKTTQLEFKKLDEFSKKIIEDLSPRYQDKLGLKAVKNWVTIMKASRAGIVVGGVGTLGTGIGAIAIRGWNWLNYDEDSAYNIINSKDEAEFNKNLRTYLKSKYPAELIRRIERKNENELTLKNFNPKDDKEVELVEFINAIVKERREFHNEEKILKDLENKLTTAIDGVAASSKEK